MFCVEITTMFYAYIHKLTRVSRWGWQRARVSICYTILTFLYIQRALVEHVYVTKDPIEKFAIGSRYFRLIYN